MKVCLSPSHEGRPPNPLHLSLPSLFPSLSLPSPSVPALACLPSSYLRSSTRCFNLVSSFGGSDSSFSLMGNGSERVTTLSTVTCTEAEERGAGEEEGGRAGHDVEHSDLHRGRGARRGGGGGGAKTPKRSQS